MLVYSINISHIIVIISKSFLQYIFNISWIEWILTQELNHTQDSTLHTHTCTCTLNTHLITIMRFKLHPLRFPFRYKMLWNGSWNIIIECRVKKNILTLHVCFPCVWATQFFLLKFFHIFQMDCHQRRVDTWEISIGVQWIRCLGIQLSKNKMLDLEDLALYYENFWSLALPYCSWRLY